mmetsp:Transcript_17979/g.25351  ORF Transcript_17979/g.25351 Transcript_17979/m.25351 type:complete len:1988 (+) Transcript_17979:258-6221(+)
MDLGVAPPPPPPPGPPPGPPPKRNKSSGRSRGRSRGRSEMKNVSSHSASAAPNAPPPPPPPPPPVLHQRNHRTSSSSPVLQQQKKQEMALSAAEQYQLEQQRLLQQRMMADSTVPKFTTTPDMMEAPPSPSDIMQNRLASSPRNNVKTAEDILEERRRAAFAMYSSTELVHDRENEAPDAKNKNATIFDDADDEELPPPEDWEQQDPNDWASTSRSTHSDYNRHLVITADPSNESLALSEPVPKSPPSAVMLTNMENHRQPQVGPLSNRSRSTTPQKAQQPSTPSSSSRRKSSSQEMDSPKGRTAPSTPTTDKKKKRSSSKTPSGSSRQRSSSKTPRQRSSSKTPRKSKKETNLDIASPSTPSGSDKKKKGFFKKMFGNNNKDKSPVPSSRSPTVKRSSSFKKKSSGAHSAEIDITKKHHSEVSVQKEKMKTQHYSEVSVNQEILKLQQQKQQQQQQQYQQAQNDLTVSSYSTDSMPTPVRPSKMEQEMDVSGTNNNNRAIVPSTPPLHPKKSVEETTPMVVEEENYVAAALAETLQQQRAGANQFIRNRDTPFVVDSMSIDEVSEMTDPTFLSDQQKKKDGTNAKNPIKGSSSPKSSGSGKDPSGKAPVDPFRRASENVTNGFFPKNSENQGESSDRSIDPFSQPFFEEEPARTEEDEKKAEEEDEQEEHMEEANKAIKADPPSLEVVESPSAILSDILARDSGSFGEEDPIIRKTTATEHGVIGGDELMHSERTANRGVDGVFRPKGNTAADMKVSGHSLQSNKSEISNGSGASSTSAGVVKALAMLKTRDLSNGGEELISRSRSRESNISTTSSAINAKAWARRKGNTHSGASQERSSSFGAESAAYSDISQGNSAVLQSRPRPRRKSASPSQEGRGTAGKSGPPSPEQRMPRSKPKLPTKPPAMKAPHMATVKQVPMRAQVKPSPFLTKNAARSRKGKQRTESAQQQYGSYSRPSSTKSVGIASRVERNGTASLLSRPPTRMVKEKERTTIKTSLYGKTQRRNQQYVYVEPQVVDSYSVSYGFAMQRQHYYEIGPLPKYEPDVNPEETRKLALSRNTSSYSGIVESQIVDPIQLAGVRLLSKSAVPIQTEIRRYLAQKEAVERMIGLIEIQCYFRRWKCEAFKTANVHAATKIQTAYRGWMVRDVLEDEHYCAGIIQIYVRSLLAKNVVKRLRSVIKIQARWRSYAAQLHYQFDIVDIIIVQNLVRRWAARRELEVLRWEKQYFSAIKIQSNWRRYVAHTDYIFTIADVLVVQRTFRKWLAEKELTNRKLMFESQKCYNAATLIQSAFRRYSARMNLLFQMVNIIVVQSIVRRKLAQNRMLELIAEHIAARRIQTKWRDKTNATFRKQRESAIHIQRIWRGFWMHSHYIIMAFEVCRIQAVWRGYSARKEADLKLGCTIILQAVARRYLARRRARQIRLVQVLVGSASFSMRENIASTCIGQWWMSILETRKRHAAATTIQKFFMMVQAEVNMEIRRHNRKKELKREQRRRKKQESEEMMLERVWLNTVTGDVVRGPDIRRSRSRSSSRSRSAPRPRSERPMTPSSVISRPITPTSFDAGSVDGSHYPSRSPGRSRRRETRPHELNGKRGQNRGQLSSNAILSAKRDMHRAKNSPKAGVLDARGHPLNIDRVKNSPRSRTGFDPRGYVPDVHTSYNSRNPRVEVVGDVKLAQSEESEISVITTPLDSHITAVYSRNSVPSRGSTLTGKQLSDDLSLEEAWVDTRVRQAKEKKQSDDQYFQRHGINRSKADSEMRHSVQPMYHRPHSSSDSHQQAHHQQQPRPRAYQRPQASFDQPHRPPSRSGGLPVPRHQQQKPPPLRTHSPLRGQSPLRNMTPVVRNGSHAHHQLRQHQQPPQQHTQPPLRQPSPQHMRLQPLDPVPTTQATKPLDPSPRNQGHVPVALPSPSRDALSPPGASPNHAESMIHQPSPTYLSKPSPSGLSPRHFDSPEERNPARQAHSPYASHHSYSPSARQIQRDQIRRGVV